jgi:hypothetical protein
MVVVLSVEPRPYGSGADHVNDTPVRGLEMHLLFGVSQCKGFTYCLQEYNAGTLPETALADDR